VQQLIAHQVCGCAPVDWTGASTGPRVPFIRPEREKKENNKKKKKKKCADDSYASCVKVHKRVNRNATPGVNFAKTITAQLMTISSETESRVKPRV
jgi:hypothetical protein